MRFTLLRPSVLPAIAVLSLVLAACGSDSSSDNSSESSAPAATTVAATESTAATVVSTEPTAETTATAATSGTPTTTATPSFEGVLTGTFSIDPADCSAGAPTSGSYFQMIQPGGTTEAGPFISNADSKCTDPNFTLLTPGTDGGLVTGSYQAAPDPAFDATGNALTTSIFIPAPFFAVAFGGATDPNEAQPTITATDGTLSGDLSAFTAYYGGSNFNQGAPKPDGSGEAPTGTINPTTGEYELTWSSKIVGGSFDGFTGLWHLQGTFTPS